MRKIKIIKKISLFFFLGSVFLAIPSLLLADFTNPTQSPPNGNVSKPIYSQGSMQVLFGGLNVGTGGLSGGNETGPGVIGISNTSGTVGSLFTNPGVVGSALYGNAFSADADDYSGRFYGGLGVLMSSGDIHFFSRYSGISWPRVSDGIDLYGVMVTTSGTLRLFGHGNGIEFLNQNSTSLVTISETGDVNLLTGSLCFGSGSGDCKGSWTAIGSASGWTDDGAVVRLTTSSDKVGIGTTTPATNLHIVQGNGTRQFNVWGPELTIQDNDSNWDYSGIDIIGGEAGAGRSFIGFSDKDAANRGMIRYLHLSDSMDFDTAGARRMSINSSGCVGIGTASPNRQLHVKTDSGNAEIDIQSASSPYWAIYQDDTTDDLRFWNVAERLAITDEGNVGIGVTNPSYKFEVSGLSWNNSFGVVSGDSVGPSISINNTSTKGRRWNIISTGVGAVIKEGSLGFYNQDNSVYALVLGESGRVGIGSTNPDSKLKIVSPNNIEGLRIISSNYSPFVIRNTADLLDLFRVNQNGEATIYSSLTVGGKIMNVSTPTLDSDAATKAYVDAAVSASGGSGGAQIFTSSGTWTRPSGVNKINFVIVGAGGGGGGGHATYFSGGSGGGGGGSGSVKVIYDVAVTKDSYSVVVGVGGTGGAGGVTGVGSWNGVDGASGTNSSFIGITVGGGGGGQGGKNPPALGGTGGATPSVFTLFNEVISTGGQIGGGPAQSGAENQSFLPYSEFGASGRGGSSTTYSGGGGGGGFGNSISGQDGNQGWIYEVGRGGQGYGAGGGGGVTGNNDLNIPGGSGGNGASGVVIIWW